jgi:hypothetical protein
MRSRVGLHAASTLTMAVLALAGVGVSVAGIGRASPSPFELGMDTGSIVRLSLGTSSPSAFGTRDRLRPQLLSAPRDTQWTSRCSHRRNSDSSRVRTGAGASQPESSSLEPTRSSHTKKASGRSSREPVAMRRCAGREPRSWTRSVVTPPALIPPSVRTAVRRAK